MSVSDKVCEWGGGGGAQNLFKFFIYGFKIEGKRAPG